MEENAGVRIGTRAFIQSVTILLILMLGAGLLTIFLPSGSFGRGENRSRFSSHRRDFHLD